MLFSLKGPIQTVCYVYVCDLTFCVSLVVHLGRFRVTLSEFEASRGGFFSTEAPIPAYHAAFFFHEGIPLLCIFVYVLLLA